VPHGMAENAPRVRTGNFREGGMESGRVLSERMGHGASRSAPKDHSENPTGVEVGHNLSPFSSTVRQIYLIQVYLTIK